MKQAYDLGINFFDTAERWVSEMPAIKDGVGGLLF